MLSSRLRTAAASLALLATLAGPVAGAHAMKNDGRFQKTQASRHIGPDTFCGDTLALYQGEQDEAQTAIDHWQFGRANVALDAAAATKKIADDHGCAWPYAV